MGYLYNASSLLGRGLGEKMMGSIKTGPSWLQERERREEEEGKETDA